MKNETQSVEFLRAWDDNTWDTEFYNIPKSLGNDVNKCVEWIISYSEGKEELDRVVCWQVFWFANE